jgi:uncharacterized repeat protein (TIGR03803 family)
LRKSRSSPLEGTAGGLYGTTYRGGASDFGTVFALKPSQWRWRKPAKEVQTLSELHISGIDIHTYLVKDPARAIAFWRDTMGLRIIWESADGAEFELPDGSTFGLWRMDDGSWEKGSGIMFAVPDVAQAAAALRANGVAVMEHIEETPVCWMAFAEDSEGNAFILHKRKIR